MSEEDSNPCIAGNSKVQELKTPLDFQVQNQTDQMTSCFSNVLEMFTIKQADIMSKIIGDMSAKQTESINQITADIESKFDRLNKLNQQTGSSSASATISVNPNKNGEAKISENPTKGKTGKNTTISETPRLKRRKTSGEATISVNPNNGPHKANASDSGDETTSSSSEGESAEIRNRGSSKRKRSTDKNKKNKKSKQSSHPHHDDVISLYGGSDIDDKIGRIVNNPSDESDSNSELEDDECIKGIANDLCALTKSGEPINKNLANVINNVVYYPIPYEKLCEKFEKHQTPENLESLRVKKCNSDIWAQVHRRIRSKDIKTQKMQTAVLKAIGVISKATDSLIKLKNTKNTNTINFKDALGSIAHEFTDSIAMLSQVNTNIEQNRKDSIAFSLGRKYYALRKNVPPESKELFGDDIAKRMATLINNKKLFESSSSSNTYFSTYDKNSKNLRRFPQNPGNQNQYGYQNKYNGPYQKHQNNKSGKHSKGKKY